MDIQWSLIWTHSNEVAAGSKKKRDTFADPLERPEWEGLGWTMPIVSRLVSGPRSAQKNPQKIKEVERFTSVTPVRRVCVS